MTAIVHVRYSRPNARHAALIRRAAGAAIELAGPPQAELTVVLTDEAGIRRLNERFAGQAHATDVLSFPAELQDPDSGLPYLGDVVISLSAAEAQAGPGGHPLVDELMLLCVHGVLHLLGHDHGDPGSRERMWSVQAEVLRRLGSQITFPAEAPG